MKRVPNNLKIFMAAVVRADYELGRRNKRRNASSVGSIRNFGVVGSLRRE